MNSYVREKHEKRRIRLNWILDNWGIGQKERKAQYIAKFGSELNHPECRYYSDVAKVNQALEKQVSFKQIEVQGDLLERYEHLYQEALNRNQIAVAAKILDSMAKLAGCYTEKVEVSVPESYIVEFS